MDWTTLWNSTLEYKWYILFGIIAIIAFVWLIKKIKGLKKHEHIFEEKGFMVINNIPRLVKVCKKCSVAIHVPIYTRKKLEEIEREMYEREFKEAEE